jgi:hypothetical protein
MCALDRLGHLEQEERAPDSLSPTLDAATRKRERAELHDSTERKQAGEERAGLAVIVESSFSSGSMSTPEPLHLITQALVSAACAYGHNTHRALCDL